MLYYISPEVNKMTVEDFFATEIDQITERDIDNAFFMRSLIGDCDFSLKELPRVSVMESVVKSLSTFDLYKSDSLNNEINIMKRNIRYFPHGVVPFYFNTQMFPDKESNIVYESNNTFCAWQNNLDKDGVTVDISLDFFDKTENDGLYCRYSSDFSEKAYEMFANHELLSLGYMIYIPFNKFIAIIQ